MEQVAEWECPKCHKIINANEYHICRSAETFNCPTCGDGFNSFGYHFCSGTKTLYGPPRPSDQLDRIATALELIAEKLS